MEIETKILRAIAIYLPQFHPVPENDAWWGKGFTEWRNVAKAKPLFKGHNQPHLPADLGFYDLRVSEVREQQAALAKEYGIYGFCYYHYWFNGRRILERPFHEVFESGTPDFPFMLCWANENWSRTWDGGSKEILIEQKYSPEDDRLHIQSLIPYFKDKRYIRIDNKPVFAIYRSKHVPDMTATIKTWREEAMKHDLELYLCRFESCLEGGKEYLSPGFDAAIDFQPWGRDMNEYKSIQISKKIKSFNYRLENLVYRKIISAASAKKYQWYKQRSNGQLLNHHIFDYSDYLNFVMNKPLPDYKVFPGVTPMWDNTARQTKHPGIALNSNPDLYKKWLEHVMITFKPFGEEENFVFINAWNEWAEGCHLEPCQRWGRKFLEVTRDVLQSGTTQLHEAIV